MDVVSHLIGRNNLSGEVEIRCFNKAKKSINNISVSKALRCLALETENNVQKKNSLR